MAKNMESKRQKTSTFLRAAPQVSVVLVFVFLLSPALFTVDQLFSLSIKNYQIFFHHILLVT